MTAAALMHRPRAIRLIGSLRSPEGDVEDAPAKFETLESIGRLFQLPASIKSRLAVRLPSELIAEAFLPLLASNQPKDLRAAAYGAMRTIAPALDPIQPALDIHLIRTFARDHRHDREKQQAMALVRSQIRQVGVGVIRAIIALAESADDRLKLTALETLAELVVLDIAKLVLADGLRVVLHALIDGPPELAPSIASILLYLADRPHLRLYLRPGVDIEVCDGWLMIFG